MKKLICILLILSMTTSLFNGCGRSKTEASPSGSPAVVSQSSGPESAASDGSSPEDAGTDGTGSGTDGTVSGSGDSGGTGDAAIVTGFGSKYVDPNIGPTGKVIVKPTTGPVGTWDIPVPFINPLGIQSLYNGGNSYKPLDALDIAYISNFSEFKQRLYGDVWFLGVIDPSGIPMQFLKDYAKEIGATVFSSAFADRLTFTLKQPDAIWWCDAVENTDGYVLHVIRQTVVATGQEYKVPADKYVDASGYDVAFVTESTGGRFQSATLGLSSGKVRVFVDCEYTNGTTATYWRYDKTFDSRISKTFILDDLPQGAGFFNWKFFPYKDDVPGEITFKLDESYDLPKVKIGDEPGALLVKGAPFGSVFVESQAFVSLDFREAGQRDLFGENPAQGSLTPEGDTLFLLPPGLWTVVNHAPYMNYGSTRTQLVPVSSGEQTTVTLPISLKSANTRLNSMADSGELTGGIAIVESRDKTTTAEVSISVSDPLERDISPTKENTVIYEGSSKVDVTDIKRVVAPCSIALVIDSSGSMKKDMKATLDAARVFIGTLPAGSFVKVIDFDAKVNVLKGETPADAAKALSGITAGGTTKLFDATLKGLETVQGKTRPAVVVFTDGVDSSMDKTGGGSVNSRSAVTSKIKESKIPVYAIGFGKRLNEADAAKANAPTDGVPDIQTLLEFASAAGGQYYPAKDPAALQGVFAAISSKLGNNFILTYTRPSEHNLSETPFISMVVDNSGSMNSDPSVGIDCNYRMEKTISLFHDFLSKIPQNAMMQFTTFQTPPMSPVLIIQQQITTDQKANILKSLGEMKASGGTPIVEVLRTAYENILPVPSKKKVIVLLTDGGLLVEPEQIGQYNALLAKIKEKNITVFFVGMGVQSKEKLFSDAAAASGGDYVISENITDIQAKLDKLLQTLKESNPPDTIPLSVSIHWITPEGEELNYAVADDVKFALPPKAGPPLEPDLVKIATGAPYKRYDVTVAASVTGTGLPGTENIITNRIFFDKKLSSRAMELTVKQGVYLSRFMGVDGDSNNKQFVALEIELENKTANSIPYVIPSIFNHFYLGVNEEGLYPASKATWLAEKPISPHGSPEVTLQPGTKTTGVLVFVVPESPGFTQQSLHFYDTNFGHIQIPLTGKMSGKWVELGKLPTSAPVKLSDTFSMKVTAATLLPKVDKVEAGERSAFQVVEAQFESKMQALLNLDPRERIWLKLDTASGALMTKMSNVTAALPLGFLEPAMLGPASDNAVRMAYDLPQGLAKYKSSLYFDLATGKAEIPVVAGTPYGAPKAAATADGPGVRIIVNQMTAIDSSLTFTMADGKRTGGFGNTVLLDVTVTDLPGNEGTRIPEDFFLIVNKNFKDSPATTKAGRSGLSGDGESNGDILKPKAETKDLVFGIDEGFGVFEGQSRRGVIVFQKPDGSLADWTLQSPYVKNLQVPIGTGAFASPELLGLKKEIDPADAFQQQLEDAVTASVAKYRSLSQGAGPDVVQVSLTGKEERVKISAPPISTYGLKIMAGIETEEQALKTLQTLRCLPINRDGGSMQAYGYAAEAVLTQGWGEIGDMTNLAKRLFAKLGYTPEVRALALTEAGRKLLLEQTGIDAERARTVPLGISYVNGNGERRMFVVPFMMDVSGLEGLVYFPSESLEGYLGNNPQTAKISVFVQYVPAQGDGTAAGTSGDAGSALGGGESGESVQEMLMLEKTMPLHELSTDPIDIGFAVIPTDTGSQYGAVIGTPTGDEGGLGRIRVGSKVLGIKVLAEGISGNQPAFSNYNTLTEGKTLDQYYFSLAINLPDLRTESAAVLEAALKQVSDKALKPEPSSALKWYGRNILYRFITNQSRYDEIAADSLGIVMGRISKPRCIMLTTWVGKDGTAVTSIDLMQSLNEIHSGEQEKRDAYSLQGGIYFSMLESAALTGDKKTGLTELWNQLPKGCGFLFIEDDEESRTEALAELKDLGNAPLLLLEAVGKAGTLIITPLKPALVNGEMRWAWLEINAQTYEATSVFDNGQHGAMVEVSIKPTTEDWQKFGAGVLVGTLMSITSLATFALVFDDTKILLKQAESLTKMIGTILDKFLSIKDMRKDGSLSINPSDFTPFWENDAGNMALGAGQFQISVSGWKAGRGKISQNLVTFKNGYDLAVKLAFVTLNKMDDYDNRK